MHMSCTLYVHRYVHNLSNKATLDLFYYLFLKGPMDFTIGFVSVGMELSFDNISFKLEECFLGKNRCLPPCVHSNYTYCDTYSKNNHPIFINANQCNFEA